MSQVVADLAMRFRLADPKPGHCSACLCASGPDVKFVDFDCLLDRGAIVEPGSMAVLDGMDALYLCEACVRQAAEVLEFRPGLHRKHLQEIVNRDRTIRQQGEYIKSLEAALLVRPGQS